jgi:hypothetical protein
MDYIERLKKLKGVPVKDIDFVYNVVSILKEMGDNRPEVSEKIKVALEKHLHLLEACYGK